MELENLNVKAELARRNIQYKDVAERIGITPNAFYRKLKANRFSLKEILSIAHELDIKIIVQTA